MESIKLWARHDEAVRQAIELGGLVHMEKAREELTDVFLLFAITSGLLRPGWRRFPLHVVSPQLAWRSFYPLILRGVLPGCTPCVERAICCVRPGYWGPWAPAWKLSSRSRLRSIYQSL